MITRPLDLSTRLRPPPRSFDYLFWVNAVVIVLMFLFFGSRFVLSPGVGVGRIDEILPAYHGAVAGAVATQTTVNITQGGQLYVDTGFVTFEQFEQWVKTQAQRNPGGTVLVHCNVNNPTELLVRVTSAVHAAGLRVQLSAVERRTDSSPR
jgi:biopolymer transport protein ExbD